MNDSHPQRRNRLLFVVLFWVISSVWVMGCADRKIEGAVVATINEYRLTIKEFETQLAQELEMDPEFKLTQEAKESFLNQLVRKELLIQEAMKMKLDRRDRFIRAIERYWQSTLIRDLLELKGEEIERQTYISEEEIADRYHRMKAEDENLPPVETLRQEITQRLKEEKKTEKLKLWIDALQKQAKIEISRELLHEKKLGDVPIKPKAS